jgi:MFS family permease
MSLFIAQLLNGLQFGILLFLLAFMGCLVGGPNNIITSAVAADLADDPSIRGNSRALGTVTGIINGSGSVTAAFGQLAIPVLYEIGKTNNVGDRYVWYFLIACTIAGTALMSGRSFPANRMHATPTRAIISITTKTTCRPCAPGTGNSSFRTRRAP